MAKPKKKGRRAALKSFARGRNSGAYPQKYITDKELVYGGGKNYKVTGDFGNLDMGATAADNDGYGYIYMNGTLYGTAAGRARASTSESTAGTTLDLTIS